MLKKLFKLNIILKSVTIISVLSILLAYLSPYLHPEKLWFLPFFGLSYPVFFFITLFLIIIWGLKRSRWAIYLSILLILGVFFDLRFFALGNPDILPKEDQTDLKIMSYNVQLFGLYNNELENELQNRDSILSYIKREEPELICFQEFYQKERPTRFSTRDTISKMMGMHYFHEKYSFNSRVKRNFGIAMISKYEIISKGDVVFLNNENFSDDNYCIYADIVKNQDTFRIYNIHFQSIKFKKEEYALFSQENKIDTTFSTKKSTARLMISKLKRAFPARANQALTVVEHIQTSPFPVIVCGDFNDTPMSFTYNQFNKLFTDAFRNCSYGIGKTFVGKIPAGRIDYIFHSNELNSYQFKVQEEVFSDHRAISCKVYKK